MEGINNRIRIVQAEIEAQLEKFEAAPDAVSVKTSYICDNVRDFILNFDDEPHLSKTQNTRRRIVIASELFNSFCGVFAHVVDYEYANIIRDIIQWEKFKTLSKKINSVTQLASRKEKYFVGEAQSKLLITPEGTRVEETNKPPTEIEGVPPTQIEGVPPTQIEDSELQTATRPCNITEIREAVADTAHSQLLLSPTLRQEELVPPNIEPETSITAPNVQQSPPEEEGIGRILQILEDGILDKETVDIQQPDNLEITRPLEETVPVPDNLPTGETGTQTEAAAPESSEGWSLPSLEEAGSSKRRRRYPVIDETTKISDYAARALKLNRSITIQRVQVFEGPPTVLQAISANYLMTTPSYKKSLFRDTRSSSKCFSELSTLYNRHLEVEKKPVEERLQQQQQQQQQRRSAEQTEGDVLKVTANTEIMEDVGMRAGMHSRPERSTILVDAREPEKSQQVDLVDLPTARAPTTDSPVGVPMSRIINSTIQPPDEGLMERINAVPEPTPSVQQLQGRSLERRTSPPWFISTGKNPPSDKYREFGYVYDRLQMYWSMFESQGMEKRITIREFISFEGDGSPANYLTVLRVADKMSIRRKVLLEYQSGDAVVRPFEIPYVTDAQLLLRGKEPVF